MIGKRAGEVHVDMGYRGHNYDGPITVHIGKRRRDRTSRRLWRWMKRRAAVEPSIGNLKNEHRSERNRLRGTYGDAINAGLSAAAMNFHKLLRVFWALFSARPAGLLEPVSAHTGFHRSADVASADLKIHFFRIDYIG